MLFSDNVSVEDEVRAQGRRGRRRRAASWARTAARRSSAGSPSASPTSCDPARSGIVAASGTGAQQVMCLLDAAGVGVSALPRGRRARPQGGRRAVARPGRRCARSPTTRRPSRSSSCPSRRTTRCSPTSRRMPPRSGCACTGPCSAPGRPDLTAAGRGLPRGRGPLGAAAGRAGRLAPERARLAAGPRAARALLRRHPVPTRR